MKKLIPLIGCSIFFLNCNLKERREVLESNITSETYVNFYTMYFKVIIDKGQKPLVININDLCEIDNEKLFRDKLTNININKVFEKRGTIKVSDSIQHQIKSFITTNEHKHAGVKYCFSYPYTYQQNKKLVFLESNFKNLSKEGRVIYFSRNEKTDWKLDSINSIYSFSSK